MKLTRNAAAFVLLRLNNALRELGVCKAFLAPTDAQRRNQRKFKLQFVRNKTLNFPGKRVVKTAHTAEGANENGNNILLIHQRERNETLQRFSHYNGILKAFVFRDIIGDAIHNQAALKRVCLTKCTHASW